MGYFLLHRTGDRLLRVVVLVDSTGRMIPYSNHARAERIREMDISGRGRIMRTGAGGPNVFLIFLFPAQVFRACFFGA